MKKLYGSAMEGRLMVHYHRQLPNQHRVGSMPAANADQVGGYMIGDILPSCLLVTLSSLGHAGPGDGGIEDFRLMMRRKVWRAVHSPEVPLRQRRILINWISVPMDQAWVRLQFMDARGGILLDLTRRHSNPLHQVAESFSSMLFEPMVSGSLAALFVFFSKERTNTRVTSHTRLDNLFWGWACN